VLILHAEDDGVVPFRLGETLFEEAVQAGKTNIRWGSLTGHAAIQYVPAFDPQAEGRT
jgi:hypothetical protein